MEEFDLGFGVGKDRAAKQGRRAAQSTNKEDSNERNIEAAIDDTVENTASRVSGWGETAGPRKKNRRNLGEGLDQLEEPNSQPKQDDPYDSDNAGDDIPVIPDLEDQQDDVISKVATAPVVAVNRVATYRELDNDLSQAAFLTLDDEIDLKILAKGLVRETDLVEEDKPWDWDHLFTEVTSDLPSQWETNNKSDADLVTSR